MYCRVDAFRESGFTGRECPGNGPGVFQRSWRGANRNDRQSQRWRRGCSHFQCADGTLKRAVADAQPSPLNGTPPSFTSELPGNSFPGARLRIQLDCVRVRIRSGITCCLMTDSLSAGSVAMIQMRGNGVRPQPRLEEMSR